MHGRAPFLLLAATLVWVGCATEATTGAVHDDIAAGRLQAARAKLEKLEARGSRSSYVQTNIGKGHYRLALAAFEAGDHDEYSRRLSRAQDAFVGAAVARPAAALPHMWMGIVALHLKQPKRALRSFRNARRLDPHSAAAHANLAQMNVYLGRVSRAHTLLQKARRLHGHPVQVELTEVLALWRAGDLTEARHTFDTAYALEPPHARVWNHAMGEQRIESFADFVNTCCADPSCGPYMRKACRRADRDVREREVARATLVREMAEERERQERLREAYQRKRIDIELEKPEVPAAPAE